MKSARYATRSQTQLLKLHFEWLSPLFVLVNYVDSWHWHILLVPLNWQQWMAETNAFYVYNPVFCLMANAEIQGKGRRSA